MSFKILMMLFSFMFFQSDAGGAGGGNAGDANEGDGDDAGNGSNANDKTGHRTAANDKAGDDAADEDVTGLKNALGVERTRAKNAERDLKAIRSELDALKNAGKSDEERRDADLKSAQTRADAAEQRLQIANARVAVTDAATKANAVSVNAVFALIRDQIEYDEGEPVNVPALIAEAKRDEPSLFRKAAGTADGAKQTSESRDIKPGLDRLTYAYETQSKTAPRPR